MRTNALAIEAGKPWTISLDAFSLVEVHGPPDEKLFDEQLNQKGYNLYTVPSAIRLKGDRYEVWVSDKVLGKLKDEFKVDDAYDPLYSDGDFGEKDVMAQAIVREQLLRRVEGSHSQVQELYLHYLKQKAPDVRRWIGSCLRSLHDGNGQVGAPNIRARRTYGEQKL